MFIIYYMFFFFFFFFFFFSLQSSNNNVQLYSLERDFFFFPAKVRYGGRNGDVHLVTWLRSKNPCIFLPLCIVA